MDSATTNKSENNRPIGASPCCGAIQPCGRLSLKRCQGYCLRAIFNAINNGKIQRPKFCSLCSRTNTRIIAHHADYTKPLKVVWLCDRCHCRVHHNIKYNVEFIPLKPISNPLSLENRKTLNLGGHIKHLPFLKREPYQLKGIFFEDDLIDEHKYFDDETLSWKELFKNLSQKEREIIKLRYGDGYEYSLEEVGKVFKVTRERIRQIEAKALIKLRRALKAND